MWRWLCWRGIEAGRRDAFYKNPPENPRALGPWDEWRLILQVLVKAVEF